MAEAALVAASTPKLHKGKGSALNQEQLAAIVKLHALGKHQTEIAQIIGCDQATVSRWLQKLTDDGQLAGAYLRANQFRLAKKIVKQARAADAIDVLDRFKSIPANSKADAAMGVTIQIGVRDSDVSISLGPPQVVVGQDLPIISEKSLVKQAGSDNQRSVNEG